MFSLRYLNPLESQKMVNQVELGLCFDRPENQFARLGLRDSKSGAIFKSVFVTDLLWDYELPVFRHVNHCHSRKLSLV